MKKIILLFFLFLAGNFSGYLVFARLNPSFKKLSPEKMYQDIIEKINYAINESVKKGSFKCCINPPCTMCYMEANQWNNYMPGTCDCDTLIAQGKKPCPQCQKSLYKDNKNSGSTCSFKPNNK